MPDPIFTSKQWFSLDERLRFITVGLVNTLIRYMIFVVIGLISGITRYQLILLASWLLSSVTAFLAYKYLVFKSDGSHWQEYLKSLLIWTLSYFINAFFLAVLVTRWGWNAYLAQALAVTAVTVVNYLLFKHFAFKIKKTGILDRFYDFFSN